MKLTQFFLIVALVGLASAGHHFFAEQNMICKLCKESLKLIKAEKFETLEMVLVQFPKAHELMENQKGYLKGMREGKSIEELCSAKYCNDEFEDFKIDHESIVEEVNDLHSQGQALWTAGKTDIFHSHTRASDIRKQLGTIVDPDWTVKLPEKKHIPSENDLPENFDSRTQWPKCDIIGRVRDQANCGSCWAFGTTEAYNDRLCIQHGYDKLLSTADTTACCDFMACFSMGCNGGQIGTPWSWFQTTGVVSGGQKADTPELCYPYTMGKCEHHVTGQYPSCPDTQQVSPTCDHKCPGDKDDYQKDKQKAVGASYTLNHKTIQKDIVDNGPITGAFTVYEDFLSYKSGIYHHVKGKALGGHAIKIIGYGVEGGERYLLVANSWNEDWGDKGYFKCTYDTISSFAAGDVSGTAHNFLGK